jgi:hypothetical protein
MSLSKERWAYARSHLDSSLIPLGKSVRHLAFKKIHFFLKLITLAEKYLMLMETPQLQVFTLTNPWVSLFQTVKSSPPQKHSICEAKIQDEENNVKKEKKLLNTSLEGLSKLAL